MGSHRKAAICLFVSILCLLAWAPAAQAGILFSDDFEGPTLDPFWSTFTQSGSITFPSTAQAHSGRQSVQLNSTVSGLQKEIQLFHAFAQPIFGRVSVWLYDTGADQLSSNYLQFDTTNRILNTRWRFVTFDYDLGPDNGGNYYVANVSDTVNTGVDRTRQWHHLVIDSTPDNLTFQIDGNTVLNRPGGFQFDTISLSMSGPSWRPAWVSYWDDFEVEEFEPTAVPEPASLTLLGLGSLALLGYGWRRWKRRSSETQNISSTADAC